MRKANYFVENREKGLILNICIKFLIFQPLYRFVVPSKATIKVILNGVKDPLNWIQHKKDNQEDSY